MEQPEQQIAETLLGWEITGKTELQSYSLSAKERDYASAILVQYFEKNTSLEQLLVSHCKAKFDPLSANSAEKILHTCNSVTTSIGPLGEIMQRDIEEIALSVGNVRVYRRGQGWQETSLVINSQSHLLHILNKLASQCGRRITRDSPVLNAFLQDGTRLHITSPPVSPQITATIRKFKPEPFTLEQLVGEKLLSKKTADFLQENVSTNSILVVGNTGSGKTTTLNALLSTLPNRDRFVFVEDVSEITLPNHSNKARLLAEKMPLSQLVYESLRMRPDRLVVSEIRNEEEVKAFANALLSGGGKTCYSTFHGQSATEALRRLELLGFRKADLDSIGLIIVQKRIDDKKTGKEIRFSNIKQNLQRQNKKATIY